MSERTAEQRLIFRLLRPHVTGCTAMQAVKEKCWGTPWAYLKESERRDKIGRLNAKGGSRWWRIGCNHIGCTAEIAVDETSILESLPHE